VPQAAPGGGCTQTGTIGLTGTLRVHVYDPQRAIGDPLAYPAALSALAAAIATLAGVPAVAVTVTGVSAQTLYVETNDWATTGVTLLSLSNPPPAAYGPRTTACSTDADDSCAHVWTELRTADAAVTVLGYPVRSCVADPATELFSTRLNTAAAMQFLGDALLRGALAGGLGIAYNVPANLRVSLASAGSEYSVTPNVGVAPWSSSLPVSTLAGADIRALPASFPGNTLGAIAVALASDCAALTGSALACATGAAAASFSVGGASYSLIGTLAQLNMVAA
jgi:hypothetical protein